MAAEDVIINFLGNTEGLQPVENVLEQIVAQGGEIGQAWSKASAAIDASNKTTVASTNKLVKGIEDLAIAAKSMDKAVIGGAYAKYLKDIQQQLGLTNKELIAFVQSARLSAQQQIFAAKTDQEIDEITLSIEAMNEQLKVLGSEEDETGSKTQTLRARLREAKEELVAMAEAGLAGTPKFVELQQVAGQLDDEMRDLNATVRGLGSDTKNIDGLISLAGGLAGGFAVAQGAVALFGDQSEEVQQALLKVNSAMAILQGLQQIQNVMQKESAASLLLTSIFYKANTVAIAENTIATEANVVATETVVAAEGAQVAATEAATVATAELNAVLALNPIALVITAVVALVAAFAAMKRGSTEAETEQRRLNDAIQQGTTYLDIYIKAIEHQSALQIANAKEARASSLEITQLEGKLGNDRLKAIDAARVAAAKAYNESTANDKEGIAAKQKLYDVYYSLDQKYQDEYNALQIKGIEFRRSTADAELKSFIAFQDAKVLATRSGSIADKNAQIENLRATRDAKDKLNPDATPGELAKSAAEDARAISDLQLQIYAAYLKSITSLDEADLARKKQNLIKNQVDTIASINAVTAAEITAIKARENEALKSNPNLSAGERAKIVAEANLQIAELEKQQEVKLLEIKRSGINAQLILAQKGTEAEYELKLKAIENAQAIDLEATELTQEKINEINARYQKQREEAQRAFNEAQLQNQISLDTAALDRFGITESQKLAITLNRINEQQALEISGADHNAAKIAEIEAKYDKARRDAKKAEIVAELNDQLATLDAFNAVAKAGNEKILGLDKSTLDEKKAASRALLDQQLFNLNLELLAEQEQLNKKLITQKEYDLAVQGIYNRQNAAIVKSEEEVTAATVKEIQKRTSSIQAVFANFQTGLNAVLGTTGLTTAITQLQNFGNSVQDVLAKINAGTLSSSDGLKALAGDAITAIGAIANQAFADSAAARQQALADQIATLEEQRTKELENTNLTKAQQSEINARFDAKEKAIKLAAFNADKSAKKTQAEINGLLAVTQAFATNPFPYSLIVAGIVAAATTAEVVAIGNMKPPKFRHGKVDIEGPGTTTSDSIPAMISRGESVINADATSKWKDALEAINSGKFEHYLTNKMADFVFPSVPDGVQINNGAAATIDYEKLSTAIAEKLKGVIPGERNIEIVNDANGQRLFVTETNSRTEYKNKRYSMT